MIKKTIALIFILQLIISCGFTPILKDTKDEKLSEICMRNTVLNKY